MIQKNIFAILKNTVIILFFSLAGILLAPKAARACCCGHHAMKEMGCKKQTVIHRSTNNSCCIIHDTATAHYPQHNPHSGQGTCNCSSSNGNGNVTKINHHLLFTGLKEVSLCSYIISSPTSGYFSLWRPPKIAQSIPC